jgi:hypothetical protein
VVIVVVNAAVTVEDSALAVETVVAAVAVDAVVVAARARCVSRVLGIIFGMSLTICTGEGVAASHQARPSRKGSEDQEHGGDVCAQNSRLWPRN